MHVAITDEEDEAEEEEEDVAVAGLEDRAFKG
jgi:hypothetical protein